MANKTYTLDVRKIGEQYEITIPEIEATLPGLHLEQFLQFTPGQPVFMTILSCSLDKLLALLALFKQLFQHAPIEGVRERESHGT